MPKFLSHIFSQFISKQTIRNYLYDYLVFQNIAVFAPKQKAEKELSVDEKNMRWALNKFFYTRNQNSLQSAFAMMLKEKYCDDSGRLLPEHPTFNQFRYFYRKTRKMENFYISRNGIKDYQKNNRPLLGDGVQSFAPTIGTAMLDGTICDIYLTDGCKVCGRPILVVACDANTSLCLGYSLLWEGGTYSLQKLMLNIIEDKVSLCERFGIQIVKEQWNVNWLPSVMVTDGGSEYTGQTFSQIAELGVSLVKLPSFRAELKGTVEKLFDLVQSSYKDLLKGKGVIMPDFQERGGHDYRKDAALTLDEFERIVLRSIVHYNSERVMENYPYTEGMLNEGVRPYASELWNYKLKTESASLISVSKRDLALTLLPRTSGKFSRFGLKVNRLRYHADGYKEQYLSGGDAVVTYNPDDVSKVWLKEKDGSFAEFSLIESRFANMSLSEVVRQQSFESIIGGSDSFTIIGESGIGKSSAVSRAVRILCDSPVISLNNANIIPCLTAQSPADSSVKGLLLEILRKADEVLSTSYHNNALRSHATVDMLIGSVSQVALTHIGLLIIDEIQNVVNSKNGKTVIGTLTQLINNSGVSICMVGTPESTLFFDQQMMLARRSLGLRYEPMVYGEEFKSFCFQILRYCYVAEKPEINESLYIWLFNHSSGNASVVVSLIHDAQEIAILEGYERLDIVSLNKAFEQRLTMLHDYIAPEKKRYPSAKKEKPSMPEVQPKEVADIICIEAIMLNAKKSQKKVIEELVASGLSILEVVV